MPWQRFSSVSIHQYKKATQTVSISHSDSDKDRSRDSEDRRMRRWGKDQFEANWQVSCAYQTRSPSQFVCWVCSVPQSRRWLQLNFFFCYLNFFFSFCIGKGDPANCGAISGDKHARTPTHRHTHTYIHAPAQVKSVWNLRWVVGWFDWPRELWLNNVPTARVVVVVTCQSIMQNGYCTLH